MEKKFKHKTTGEIGYYKDGIFKQGNCCVEIGVPPSSEFWEEVVKDYEILSFKNEQNNSVYFPSGNDSNMYTTLNVDNFQASSIGNRDLKYCLKYYTIQSVKRLSDGEVFSVGDKLGIPSFNFPISEFKICDKENTILVSSYLKFGSDGNYNTRLKNVNKVRNPILVTEDGVELYEDDKYYVIYKLPYNNIHGMPYNIIYDTWSVKGLFTVGRNPEDYINTNIKYFAEKSKAEEYVRLNEPKYSLKDIEDALSGELFNSLRGVVIKDTILTILAASKK